MSIRARASHLAVEETCYHDVGNVFPLTVSVGVVQGAGSRGSLKRHGVTLCTALVYALFAEGIEVGLMYNM